MSLTSTPLNSLYQNHNIQRPTRGASHADMSAAFNRIKRSLSRKNSNPPENQTKAPSSSRGSAFAPLSSNLFSSPSPPTRRPGSNGASNASYPNDLPPAYSAVPPVSYSQPAPTPTVATTADDPYAFLTSFDTLFLIDDSGSMAGRGWRETSEALKLIAPICAAHDEDGIDIYFLNEPDRAYFKNVTSAATVTEIFQSVSPNGGTPTGQKLNKILRPYLQRYEANPDSVKPINIIVITDGEPSDDLESPLIAAARKLDKLEAPAWQVGVQFFQVGNDPSARDQLKRLDDDLRDISGVSDLRDMIDTVAFQGDGGEPLSHTGVLKVVCGSINRRIDRNSSDIRR